MKVFTKTLPDLYTSKLGIKFAEPQVDQSVIAQSMPPQHDQLNHFGNSHLNSH